MSARPLRPRPASAFAMAAFLAATAFAGAAAAAGQDIAADLDQTVGGYTDFAKQASTLFAATASDIFWKLAAADFAIACGLHAYQRSDWSEVVLDLMRRVGVNSLFYLFLTNYAGLASEVIEFLRAKGGANTDAAGIYAQGAEILTTINDRLKGVGFPAYLSPPVLMAGLAAIIIVVAFAWLGALMVLALVEAYFVTASAVLVGAFTGAGITRSIGLAGYRAPLASAMKLLAVELLVQLGAKQVDAYQALIASASSADLTAVTLKILGGVLIFVALVQVIPGAMAAVVGGGGFGGNPLAAVAGQAAATASGVVAGTTASVAGGGLAAKESVGAAMDRQRADGGRATFLGTVGGAAKELTTAYGRDIGARLAGRAPYGTAGGRMAADIAARRAEASKPAPRTPDPAPPPTVRGPADPDPPPAGETGPPPPDDPRGPDGGGDAP